MSSGTTCCSVDSSDLPVTSMLSVYVPSSFLEIRLVCCGASTFPALAVAAWGSAVAAGCLSSAKAATLALAMPRLIATAHNDARTLRNGLAPFLPA
ncbi:hypothetical protein ABJB75_02060 [Bifidobacterium animalis]|uniref:hypothetical protein n=1 Tax=Bifidobacterium animalis TaxID=28025 RepID=UPI0032664E44